MMETCLMELRELKKEFDRQEVLKGLSLAVRPGEFLTLLGPSGCGKTTTLRIVAGLETPTSGAVLLDGQDVTALPPEKRPLNTVFQNYALFPHMNVEQNIAYGLRIRGMKRAEVKEKVKQMLDLVQLTGYEKRMPEQLSGGQRQRIAIARAVVLKPKLLLLDEPLGALDLKLRRQMQKELKQMQKQLGMAFVYVTHDQEEALNMSDRIAVMNAGKLEQLDTPENVYERPATLFAATFVGQSNLIACRVKDKNVVLAEGVLLPADTTGITGEATMMVRPEKLTVLGEKPEGAAFACTVKENEYVGGVRRLSLVTDGGTHLMQIGMNRECYQPGQRVYAAFDSRDGVLLGEKCL